MPPERPSEAPDAMLLTRRAAPDELPALAALFAEAGVPADAGARLVEEGGVLVLADVAAPSGARALALVALDLDPSSHTAHLVGVAVGSGFRRHGLGRRLLADAATLLQAQGYEWVTARAEVGSRAPAFLEACRFRRLPSPGGPVGAGGAVGPGEETVGECDRYIREL